MIISQRLGPTSLFLEEPLSVRPGVWFSMIRRGDRFEYRPEMGLKLGMAVLRIEHVPQPCVLEQHHSHALGSRRLGENMPCACLWAVVQGCRLSRSFALAQRRPRFRRATISAGGTVGPHQNACSRWRIRGLAQRCPGMKAAWL